MEAHDGDSQVQMARLLIPGPQEQDQPSRSTTVKRGELVTAWKRKGDASDAAAELLLLLPLLLLRKLSGWRNGSTPSRQKAFWRAFYFVPTNFLLQDVLL